MLIINIEEDNDSLYLHSGASIHVTYNNINFQKNHFSYINYQSTIC